MAHRLNGAVTQATDRLESDWEGRSRESERNVMECIHSVEDEMKSNAQTHKQEYDGVNDSIQSLTQRATALEEMTKLIHGRLQNVSSDGWM